MLEERLMKWKEQWLEKGRREGFEEGRREAFEEGRRLGMAETLKNVASQRFGELPQWAVERIDNADDDTLSRWGCRVLDAERLEGVFADGPD